MSVIIPVRSSIIKFCGNFYYNNFSEYLKNHCPSPYFTRVWRIRSTHWAPLVKVLCISSWQNDHGTLMVSKEQLYPARRSKRERFAVRRFYAYEHP